VFVGLVIFVVWVWYNIRCCFGVWVFSVYCCCGLGLGLVCVRV